MRSLLGWVALFLLMIGGSAYADTFDIMAPLETARTLLVAFVSTTDNVKQQELLTVVRKATGDVTQNLNDMLQDPQTPEATKARLQEFKVIWEAFQRTRESEIIPAVLNGNAEKAQKIAMGIQLERYHRMIELLQ